LERLSFQSLPTYQRFAAEKPPFSHKSPAADPIGPAPRLEHVRGRRHEPRRLHGLLAAGSAADRGELHEPRPRRRFVPPGYTCVGVAEIDGPRDHTSILTYESGSAKSESMQSARASALDRLFFEAVQFALRMLGLRIEGQSFFVVSDRQLDRSLFHVSIAQAVVDIGRLRVQFRIELE
jgi:hypothetical protein